MIKHLPAGAPLRVLAVALLPLFLFACGGPQAPTGGQTRPPAAVSVVELKSEPVALQRELPGRTRAYVIAEVRPLVTGIVRERLFREGDEVEAGEPLYQLVDEIYRADVDSARAAVKRAEAAVDLARLDADRAEELRETKAISASEHDRLLATYREAKADLEYARAQLNSATVMLGYARVRSPIAGRVGKSTVTAGALVTAGQEDALTVVQQLDPIYVDVTQAASELSNLRRALSSGAIREAEGIPVRILFDDGTEYLEPGQLTFSDVSVDPMTGSIAIRIVVPNPDRELLPGMYVRAVVSNAVLQDGLLVPQQGITRNAQGEAIAMVVGADNTVEARTVDVTRAIGNRWLVRSGLATGDRVIVEGLQKIAPGAPVQVTVVDASAL
jgi:membrane fusion protein (multidrug efflux system)